MAINYQVKQGDCISSIAFEHGFFPDTIWNHANNKQLKERRKDPNVLLPGDVVYIPDKQLKELSEPTNDVYKYRVMNVPAKFALRLLFNGAPRKNEPYTLDIDGKVTNGQTDGDGFVKLSISPSAKRGSLVVGTGANQTRYALNLGQLDPADQIAGVQKRLNNLGFKCGRADGTFNPETKAALEAFQAYAGLPITGELDDATKSKLKQEHERT